MSPSRTRRSAMSSRAATRLPLRRLEWVDEGHVESEQGTFCPFRGVSASLACCRACSHFGHLEADAALICLREAPLPAAEAAGLLLERRICTGPDSLAARVMLGELCVTRTVCTASSTPISTAAVRVVAANAPGCIVVDEQRRPVGVVSRARLVSFEPAWLPIGECATDPFVAMPENSLLAEGIACMTQEHQRIIVTTGADARATGLVTDLDVLRWMAQHREKT